MRNNLNNDYDPAQYWSTVAGHIASRKEVSVIAGDDEPFLRYKREKFLSNFLASMEVAGRSVLEVGCGPGGNLQEIIKAKPARLAAVDISQEMINLARANTGSERVEFAHVPDGKLPFADEEFDLVFTVTVLQHNIDEVAIPLIGEICRIAKTEVILVEDTAFRRIERFSHLFRTIDEYSRVMNRFGFNLSEAKRLNHFITQVATGISRRILSKKVHEGDTRSSLSRKVEYALTQSLKWLDDIVPVPVGLSKMDFAREAGHRLQ